MFYEHMFSYLVYTTDYEFQLFMKEWGSYTLGDPYILSGSR